MYVRSISSIDDVKMVIIHFLVSILAYPRPNQQFVKGLRGTTNLQDAMVGREIEI